MYGTEDYNKTTIDYNKNLWWEKLICFKHTLFTTIWVQLQ